MGWRVVQWRVPLWRAISESRSEIKGDEPEEEERIGIEDESVDNSLRLATIEAAGWATSREHRWCYFLISVSKGINSLKSVMETWSLPKEMAISKSSYCKLNKTPIT